MREGGEEEAKRRKQWREEEEEEAGEGCRCLVGAGLVLDE